MSKFRIPKNLARVQIHRIDILRRMIKKNEEIRGPVTH